MTAPAELDDFARDTVQDALLTAEANDSTVVEAYTQRMLEHLTDAGETDDALACYHRARGIEVSGYGVNADSDTVDVFLSQFRQDVPRYNLTKTELETAVRRLAGFVRRCREGYSQQIEDASPAFDMVQDLEGALKTARKVRLFVLTNGLSKLRTLEADVGPDMAAEVKVWDLERLHRLLRSGTLHEPIVVDFVERFGAPLACLSTPETDRDYAVLMTIIPGGVLDNLYAEFGSRLLELNVRSFLQAKGAVNRGIRDTLINNPERFLAYNNGISATASRVETTTTPDGGLGIVRLHDLQIVNGGQTTASIHTTARRGKIDLGKVFVQAKVTVVSPERLLEIVPSISRYSNTQNKVTTADFSSNDGFHVDVEKLSRSVWAPSPTGDGQETHWFYERARGQYADELARRTPAQQRAWKLANPSRQKFTKTDLAKFENAWAQKPHLVSRGAEKNFREFMATISDATPPPVVDETSFRNLVAKAILFRQTEGIVSAQQYGGYRAQVVSYTIARLVRATDERLDLHAIWLTQGLSPALRDAIAELSRPVQASLVTPPNGANISEWCKNVKAWMRVEAIPWTVPAALESELLGRHAVRSRDRQQALLQDAARAQPLIDRAASVAAPIWLEAAAWAKENDQLEPFQRGLALNLGRRAERGLAPTDRQAKQGLALLQEAVLAGFQPQSPLPSDLFES
ncbi:AIPR family protein [Pseudonocardia sp. WMMC193]|uniref:AIPR family protein n=1 Tax=Pseudonocardia sp. WMMC193 TaxID=2911965 RepID=UPI001F3347EB|nr:AIPR family protein [Pseudonocardia sp. WMMC193]MCF7552182.1 AIPR family protein [Pseudonocardia sp. WMMC193]